MNSNNNTWKQVILRGVIVSGLVIAFGFIVYQSSIFTPTTPPFLFLVTGVTIGISYAAFKSSVPRNGFIALFVWYVILTGRHASHNAWIFILEGSYIMGITGAIYLYILIADKPFINGRTQRIVASTLIIGIVNGLIVIFLGLFRIGAVVAHPEVFLQASYYNLKIGAVMGILSGLGIELAEYVIKRLSLQEQVAS